MMQSTVVVVDS